MSSSENSNPFSLPKSSSISSSSTTSFRKFDASKMEYLYEISYLPESKKVPLTDLPLVNLYLLYTKPRQSITKTDNTHLHFGAVRFSLNLHGRKCLPTVSIIALLESHFSEYQYACIGTVETTFSTGTALVKMFPNFNMPYLIHKVGLLGKPLGKNDDPIIPTGWDDDCNRYNNEWDWNNNPPPSHFPMAMFHPPIHEEFPPLETFEKDHSTHSWKIKNLSTRSSESETVESSKEFSNESTNDNPPLYMADQAQTGQSQTQPPGKHTIEEPEVLDEDMIETHVTNNYYFSNGNTDYKK
ncbi:unnamed protein product [Fraxinus pennsylvanica]|uniref:Uncharacterized protein n=1 Tax=Fraxinus pennsylvanica TaxID=56036 RepID=A0AAD2DXW8_9LAMI|nr:unnamed protein product [Fraxinus pennsylvanica]